MTKALMVTSSFLPGRGGIESYLAQLCDELSPALAVLAPGTRDRGAIPSDLGYRTIGHDGRMLIPSRTLAAAIAEQARALGTDKVLFGTPWPLILLAPRLARAGLTYSVIVHGAELVVPAAVPVLRKRLARALAGADLVLPVSHYTGGAITRLLGRFALAVPPLEVLRARVDLARFTPDVDTSSVRPELGLPPEARIILAFGRLVPRKGVDRLIRVLPEVNDSIPEAVVVVAGTGPELKKLKRLAARTPGRVCFAGRVADEMAPAYYAAADVFALPVVDRWFGLEIEGLGVVLLEAHACGTPAVTGRSGGTPEAVLDGETGRVVDARDDRALREALVEVLENPDAARRMGLAGREHVRREFTGKAVPSALLDWLG